MSTELKWMSLIAIGLVVLGGLIAMGKRWHDNVELLSDHDRARRMAKYAAVAFGTLAGVLFAGLHILLAPAWSYVGCDRVSRPWWWKHEYSCTEPHFGDFLFLWSTALIVGVATAVFVGWLVSERAEPTFGRLSRSDLNDVADWVVSNFDAPIEGLRARLDQQDSAIARLDSAVGRLLPPPGRVTIAVTAVRLWEDSVEILLSNLDGELALVTTVDEDADPPATAMRMLADMGIEVRAWRALPLLAGDRPVHRFVALDIGVQDDSERCVGEAIDWIDLRVVERMVVDGTVADPQLRDAVFMVDRLHGTGRLF